MELVTVLESDDTFGLGLATAALGDAGIEYVVSCDEHGHHPAFPTAFPIGGPPIAMCWCRVQVAREDEARARELVEPFEKPQAQPGE